MRRYSMLCLCLMALAVEAQQYEEFELRLEPVWSRVADVFGERGSVESVEFSPDSKYIISGTKFDNSVVVWRTSDGAEIWRQYTTQEVERAGFSFDGRYAAACSEDYLLTLYNAQTGEKLSEIKHNNGIDGLAWANTKNLVASGEEESDRQGKKEAFIRIFEAPGGKEVKRINFEGTVNELSFSYDDKLLLAAGHGSVRVYNTEDWSLLRVFKNEVYTKFISGVFSPDGKHLFISDKEGFLYLWEVASGKLIKKFNHTGKKIETTAWHPSGKYLLTAGHDSYIRIYRLEDIPEYDNDRIPVACRIWASDHAEYLDFNSDGSFLVSAHQNGLIKLWVWMGEDPGLNEAEHQAVKKRQKAYNARNNP